MRIARFCIMLTDCWIREIATPLADLDILGSAIIVFSVRSVFQTLA